MTHKSSQNSLEETLQIAKEMKELAKTFLSASDLTEEELERRLQDPDYYPPEIKALVDDYMVQIELAIQRALDTAKLERLKKEEAVNKAKMSHWIYVK